MVRISRSQKECHYVTFHLQAHLADTLTALQNLILKANMLVSRMYNVAAEACQLLHFTPSGRNPNVCMQPSSPIKFTASVWWIGCYLTRDIT